MGSCFKFSFKKKQSYAFHNEHYAPTREDAGRYRTSVTVQSWTEPRDHEDTYTTDQQNGFRNGHHSPGPTTPIKQRPADDIIYDKADPPKHAIHADEDRHSVSSKGSSKDIRPNGHVGEKDADSIHSDGAPVKPVEAKKPQKVKEIPVHDMENPPPFNHKLNDYQKTCIEMENDGDGYHEHNTVVLGGYASPAVNGHDDDEDAASTISSHPSIHLEEVELEAQQNALNEVTVTSDTVYEEYDYGEDTHTPHELVY